MRRTTRSASSARPAFLACSPGGHRAQLRRALDGIDIGDAYELTFNPRGSRLDLLLPSVKRRYHLVHPRRSAWRTLLNTLQSGLLLLRWRPRLVISTGADVAVATVVLAKIILRADVIYIETCGALRPTLSGRLCYRFADLFIVQWPEQLAWFPRATLAEGQLV